MKMPRKPQIGNEFLMALVALMFIQNAIAQQTTTVPSGDAHQQSSASRDHQEPAETIVLPAGTQLALVLTHPVDSKSLRHANEIYAQLTAPVAVGGRVVVPPGAFLQGRVEKVVRCGTRGEFLMQSLSLVFPDGSIADFTGPASIEATEGTVWLNPSDGTKAAALAAPAAGLGLGALFGSLAHTTDSSTLAGTTITTRSPKGLAIGSAVGLLVGSAISLALIVRSHQYYVAAGSPMEMTLPRPWAIAENQAGGQDSSTP